LPTPRIRLGVSACLLGQRVRYDGDHARDEFVAATLAREFELIAVCPEAELGMGTPRETVHLVGQINAPRMVGTASGRDWTTGMNQWCTTRLGELEKLGLSGFIFKKNSPSCGLLDVRVHPGRNGTPDSGRGLFAAAFCRRFPHLPVAESEHLAEPTFCADFLHRVRAAPRR